MVETEKCRKERKNISDKKEANPKKEKKKERKKKKVKRKLYKRRVEGRKRFFLDVRYLQSLFVVLFIASLSQYLINQGMLHVNEMHLGVHCGVLDAFTIGINRDEWAGLVFTQIKHCFCSFHESDADWLKLSARFCYVREREERKVIKVIKTQEKVHNE